MMMMGGPPTHPGAMVGRPPPMMGGSMMNSSSPSMGGMPVGPMPASIGGVQAHTTLFVGNISAGITDPWLHSLLGVSAKIENKGAEARRNDSDESRCQSCGPLRSFKRVNTSFGFADFADPDSVLRALAVLSGKELPPLGAENQDKVGARKALTVKADAKTRTFLDQYEQEKERTEVSYMRKAEHWRDLADQSASQYDERFESQARDGVEAVIQQMLDPANNTQSTQVITPYNVPSHLNDLPPEELPEEHRGAVLSEIDKFRQASAARQEEQKRKDRVQELERKRAPPAGIDGRDTSDRQSYLRPVSFVAKEGAEEENTLRADERDEQDEQRRSQREKEDLMRSAHDAERRYMDRERNRLAYWERELAKERAIEDGRSRDAMTLQKLFEGWSQTRQVESNMFYVERQRWRLMRKNAREREEADDEADRKAQVDEEARAKVEAERFLARQAEDMAAFEAQQRAAGVLIPGEGSHAPLKLKVAEVKPVVSGGAVPSSEAVQVGLLGNVEDDSDLTGLRRGKLAHIDLHDTSTGDLNREERKTKVRQNLPKDAEELFEMTPEWQHLEDKLIETNYRLLLDRGIVDSIGESVPDMVDELVVKVKAHASAKDLIGVVEAVLEEEATPLIEKLWRELLIDTMSV